MERDLIAGGKMKRVESAYVKQLDVLRGLAILLMVINHAGFALLSPSLQQAPILAAFIFIGGFAPVIFFFTTGFGIGIARTKVSLEDFRSTLFKALLLIVADQFFFWSRGTRFGLDFLSFIAISTVLVTAVAAYQRPIRLSFILVTISILLRFVLGRWLRSRVPLSSMGEWIFGVGSVDGVSYPLSPWIIYPLLGFIMARLYKSSAGSMTRWLWPWPSVTGLMAIVAAIAMSFTSAVFFRWGTVSLAFFVLSVGAIYVSIVAVWPFQSRMPRTAAQLSLRGIASLAVVPIHYALIEAAVSLSLSTRTIGGAALTIIGLILLTISLANAFANLIRLLMSRASNVVTIGSLAILVLLSAIGVWVALPQSASISAYVLIGQLGIAGLLAARGSPSTILRTKPAVPIDT